MNWKMSTKWAHFLCTKRVYLRVCVCDCHSTVKVTNAQQRRPRNHFKPLKAHSTPLFRPWGLLETRSILFWCTFIFIAILVEAFATFCARRLWVSGLGGGLVTEALNWLCTLSIQAHNPPLWFLTHKSLAWCKLRQNKNGKTSRFWAINKVKTAASQKKEKQKRRITFKLAVLQIKYAWGHIHIMLGLYGMAI